MKRIGLILLGVLMVLVVVSAGIFLYISRRPFPKTSGTITLNGLQNEVTILRDEYGVPHIYAQNEADLLFAQGYIHAQDRFWQMEFWRHIGQGRVAEIVGEAALDTDKFIRTIGWNRIAAETVQMYKTDYPELYAFMEAYSAGVNAYIAEHKDTFSLNKTILGLQSEAWEIEPWEPLDTVSWSVVMSWDLSGNWEEELFRAELVKLLGKEQAAALLPFYPENRPVIVPTDSSSYLPTLPNLDWSRIQTPELAGIPVDGFAFGRNMEVGSNNWVVSGEHTASGKPLLANDPHLAIQMPAIWYIVGLHAPGWDVTGLSFAGSPGIVIGHNDKIAWGVTNASIDTQDLFIEKLNPNVANQYEFMGKWYDMTIIEERIKVNGGEDVILPVRITRHGPIINEEEMIEDPSLFPLAFSWATAQPSRLLNALVLLNRAQNYDDFRNAMQYWDTAAQNTIYADMQGNIAYQMPGLVPIRKSGDGLVPVPGWTGEFEWQGWIPYEELPALYNPPQGYIVTANNAIVDTDYPYLLDFTWADGDRAQRIDDMIAGILAQRPITIEDFATIQNDSYSLLAASYVPLFAGLNSNNAQVQAALERLRGWDYQERRESVPAALFEIFTMQLANAALADDLAGAEEDTVSGVAGKVLFHALAQQPNATWWDNLTTSETETRDQIILQALEQTVAWFEENVSNDMNDWTWGNIHTATFVSNPLGQSGIGILESIVNRGPFPADGGRSLVNANSWSWSNPANLTGHVSMRIINDLSNFDQTLVVIPTGQSGHPYHRHYDDMIELWLNGQYHTLSFSPEAVEEAAKKELTLKPTE